MTRRLVIASNNAHKVAEIAAMLGRARDEVVRELDVIGLGSLPEYGSPPRIEEIGSSFADNAVIKADGFAAWLRMAGLSRDDLVLADDSGLCVEALDDGPGVHSARFAGPRAGDADNNRKLVAELEARGLDGSPAEYVCVLAIRHVGARSFDFTLPDAGSLYMRDKCLCVEGRCSGEIRSQSRGLGGFGYDPHFWIDGGKQTFAELAEADKARRSHRGAAMRRLLLEMPLILQ